MVAQVYYGLLRVECSIVGCSMGLCLELVMGCSSVCWQYLCARLLDYFAVDLIRHAALRERIRVLEDKLSIPVSTPVTITFWCLADGCF